MNWVYPVSALAVLFYGVIPLGTLVARAALSRRRRLSKRWSEFGSNGVFAWLVAPVLLPVAWLISSAVRQSAPGYDREACFMDHVHAACSEQPWLLALTVASLFGPLVWRALSERRVKLGPSLGLSDPRAVRVSRIFASTDGLRGHSARVVVHAPAPLFVLGWLRPRVVVSACFVDACEDDVLRAALLHELAHLRGYDTLRALLGEAFLALNPAGWVLREDFARWRAAREALCDAEAVSAGGDALALAAGLISTARRRCSCELPSQAVAFVPHETMALKLRVALLMDTQRPPPRSYGNAVLAALLIVAIAVPHVLGTAPLDHFHFLVEHQIPTLVGLVAR